MSDTRADFFISIDDLRSVIGTPDAPIVYDV